MPDAIIRIPDEMPCEEDIYEAYGLELQSQNGKSVPFGDLVAGKGGQITTIVIFIRHFFCAYDKDYVRSVAHHLTDSILATLPSPAGPSQLIIIGCGDSSRIVPYVAETGLDFPIYTDRSGKIYEKLQMKRTISGIERPPSYTEMSFFRALMKGFKGLLLHAFRGGSWKQNGGEWVFRDGKCVYMHRMEDVSDHLTADQLLEVLRQDENPREKGGPSVQHVL